MLDALQSKDRGYSSIFIAMSAPICAVVSSVVRTIAFVREASSLET